MLLLPLYYIPVLNRIRDKIVVQPDSLIPLYHFCSLEFKS